MGVDFGAMLFYGFELIETDDSDVYNEEGEFDENLYVWYNENPVTIVDADRYYHDEKYVCVTDTFYNTMNGNIREVELNLEKESKWNDDLRKFCTEHGLQYSIPHWYLVSTIS